MSPTFGYNLATTVSKSDMNCKRNDLFCVFDYNIGCALIVTGGNHQENTSFTFPILGTIGVQYEWNPFKGVGGVVHFDHWMAMNDGRFAKTIPHQVLRTQMN